MKEERKEQPRRGREVERKGEDGRRIPADGEIVKSHCGVPYGIAADGSTLPAACRKRKLCQRGKHTREEAETSAAKEKEKLPQRLRWEFCARTNTV